METRSTQMEYLFAVISNERDLLTFTKTSGDLSFSREDNAYKWYVARMK